MLKIINELPNNVLDIYADRKITGKNYKNGLIPAVESKLKANKKFRTLYHLGNNFTRFDLNAMLDDARMGMKHLSAWGKIALVTDHEMITTFTKFFGYMLSCELRIFKIPN